VLGTEHYLLRFSIPCLPVDTQVADKGTSRAEERAKSGKKLTVSQDDRVRPILQTRRTIRRVVRVDLAVGAAVVIQKPRRRGAAPQRSQHGLQRRALDGAVVDLRRGAVEEAILLRVFQVD
jgi:hypothetical protein